jgi:hypothetical protein
LLDGDCFGRRSRGHVKLVELPSQFASEPERQTAYEHRAMVCAAGGLAERRYLNLSDGDLEGHWRSLDDLHRADCLIRDLIGDDEVRGDQRLEELDAQVRGEIWRDFSPDFHPRV